MKGGGLTWVGWLMVGGGVMFIYAGMTGQSVVSELAAVLNGKSPKAAPAPISGGSLPGSAGSSSAADRAATGGGAPEFPHPPTIPNPRY